MKNSLDVRQPVDVRSIETGVAWAICKARPSNGSIELSQSTFPGEPEMQQDTDGVLK